MGGRVHWVNDLGFVPFVAVRWWKPWKGIRGMENVIAVNFCLCCQISLLFSDLCQYFDSANGLLKLVN